ncbi:MAG: hypothetical protein ACYDGR_05645 [Candidatus Dormibacteria bacterium]
MHLPRARLRAALTRYPAAPLAAVFAVLAPLLLRVTVQGDGIGYFSYLPAWFRGSMEFGPEYHDFLASRTPVYLPQLTTITAAGHHENLFPIGPALLSLPAYALARLGGAIAGYAHPPATWVPGTAAFSITSALFGLAGLVLSLAIASRFAGRHQALAAVFLCWLAGPLLFYTFLEPGYSHTFSTFAVALFIAVVLATRHDAPPWRWFAAGLAGGVMAITRWQDGLFLLVGGALLLEGWGARRILSVGFLGRGALFTAAAVAVALPQLLATHAIFGYWVPRPGPDIRVDLLHPEVLQLLFSSHHGLFSWSPVLLPGVLGLALLLRRRPLFAGSLLLVLALEILVSAAVTDWWAGVAFGARRLVGAFPLFALGTAVLLERLPAARRRLLYAGGGVLVAWNLVLVAQFRYIQDGDADPGYVGLLRGQLEALPRVPRLFGGSAVHEALSGVVHGDPVRLLAGVSLALLLAAGALVLAAAGRGLFSEEM